MIPSWEQKIAGFLDLKCASKWACQILQIVVHCAAPSIDHRSLVTMVQLKVETWVH